MSIEFTLKGKNYVLSRQEVENKMKGVLPEKIYTYYVEINGEKYPPKQIIARSLGLGKVEFTTMDAGNILRRLDFKLQSDSNKIG